MHPVEAGAGGNCLFHSLLAGEHTPKPHPSDYKPPTSFKKYYLTPRPFVSSSLSALRDLQTRIGHAIDLPPDHVQMRRRIVDFERDHLDHEIFREVYSLSGSQPPGIYLPRTHITAGKMKLPEGSICNIPEQYLTV